MYKTLKPTSPRIRPLPFPFRAAVSISNDIEYFSADFFEEFNKFLNTKMPTRLGLGLGLEITQSLFFYSHDPQTLAYFAKTEPVSELSQYSSRLGEYLKSGWIDTNHSFGDFEKSDDFRREHAERSYEALERLGVKLPIFTVHGGYSNTQSIGPGFDHHRGDRPGTPQYHADLFVANGVNYIWSDCGKMIDETPMIQASPREKSLPKSSEISFWKPKQKPKAAIDTPDNLLLDYTLQDGQSYKGFKRYRATGAFAPNLSSFLSQIRSMDWESMYQNFGFHIIYQHFGVLCKTSRGITPSSIEAIQQVPELYLSPLRYLANASQDGLLWVAGLFRFLRYIEMVSSVEIDFSNETEGKASWKTTVRPEFFEGLTIYIDPKVPFRLTYGGLDLPLRYNGPDADGRYSVTVPLRKLETIW